MTEQSRCRCQLQSAFPSFISSTLWLRWQPLSHSLGLAQLTTHVVQLAFASSDMCSWFLWYFGKFWAPTESTKAPLTTHRGKPKVSEAAIKLRWSWITHEWTQLTGLPPHTVRDMLNTVGGKKYLMHWQFCHLQRMESSAIFIVSTLQLWRELGPPSQRLLTVTHYTVTD